MNNILCRSVVVSAPLAPDGETPTEGVATQEANAYAVWTRDCDNGARCLRIEHAVDAARAMRAALRTEAA